MALKAGRVKRAKRKAHVLTDRYGRNNKVRNPHHHGGEDLGIYVPDRSVAFCNPTVGDRLFLMKNGVVYFTVQQGSTVKFHERLHLPGSLIPVGIYRETMAINEYGDRLFDRVWVEQNPYNTALCAVSYLMRSRSHPETPQHAKDRLIKRIERLLSTDRRKQTI